MTGPHDGTFTDQAGETSVPTDAVSRYGRHGGSELLIEVRYFVKK